MTIDWTTIIITALSSLLSGGVIGSVVFFRENKRARQLENESTASAQWRELYEKAEAKVEAQNGKIEALFRDNGRLRDQNNSLTTQRAVLSIYKCVEVGCSNRRPPFGAESNQIANK